MKIHIRFQDYRSDVMYICVLIERTNVILDVVVSFNNKNDGSLNFLLYI